MYKLANILKIFIYSYVLDTKVGRGIEPATAFIPAKGSPVRQFFTLNYLIDPKKGRPCLKK